MQPKTRGARKQEAVLDAGKFCGVAAAMFGSAIVGGLVSSRGAKSQADATLAANQANIEANKGDPRINDLLYGTGTDNPGLLAKYMSLGNTPQSAGLLGYGKGADDYLGANGMADMQAMRDASGRLMNSNISAPQVQAAQANRGPGADVLWNTGESYSAPGAMQGARIGAPQQVTGAMVQQPQGMTGAQMSGAQVNAPAQNGLNLNSAYDRFINGNSAENPYLTGAIGKGIDQSRNAFDSMQQSATDNLLKNVLPSIRSGAVLAGGYGGSRQGIAEGNAIGDMQKAQQQSISQFGQNNTDAAVSAQSGQFSAGQDRALAATQGLSGQQYGVAGQNASMDQQARMANQASTNDAARTNYGGVLAGAMANAGYGQQAALANQGANLSADTTNAGFAQDASRTTYAGDLSAAAGSAGNRQQANLGNQQAGNNASMFNSTQYQQNEQYNAGLRQQGGLSNQQSQISTNGLNSSNRLAGIGASQGVLAGAYGAAGSQDQYGINRAGQVNNLLQPYLSRNPMASNVQPVYSNTGGAALGGAMTGLGLYNMYSNMNFGGQPYGGAVGNSSQPYGSNGVY